MEEVTLAQVLAAREARAAAQKRMLAAYRVPLVSVTMNMAGPVKRTGLSDFAFRDVVERLEEALGPDLAGREETDAPTGLEVILACARPAEELKALALELEESQEVGRLYDVDVIGGDGGKLSRSRPRTCLVCGGPALPCARSRAHGLPAVQAATDRLLREFAAGRLSELAEEALLAEVELTPKPGLVDRRNSGAHRDMDLALFRRSARALRPYFRRAAALGMEREDCMPQLQAAGLAAEAAMLAATGGVNTHKGAVYSFGLILAAMGSVLVRGGDLFETAAALASGGRPPAEDRPPAEGVPLTGARGEALAGFPHARRALAALEEGGPYAALLELLARVPDTNLLRRGGAAGLAFVQEQAADILSGPAEGYVPRLEALDDGCIRRNLSPGGSADLLALAFLLRRVKGVWGG